MQNKTRDEKIKDSKTSCCQIKLKSDRWQNPEGHHLLISLQDILEFISHSITKGIRNQIMVLFSSERGVRKPTNHHWFNISNAMNPINSNSPLTLRGHWRTGGWPQTQHILAYFLLCISIIAVHFTSKCNFRLNALIWAQRERISASLIVSCITNQCICYG